MTSRAKTVAMATPDLHRRSLLLGAGLTTGLIALGVVLWLFSNRRMA